MLKVSRKRVSIFFFKKKLFKYTSNFATLVACGVTCDLLQGQGQGYSRCWRSVCVANVTHQRWVGTATGVASLVMNTATGKKT